MGDPRYPHRRALLPMLVTGLCLLAAGIALTSTASASRRRSTRRH